MLSRCLDQASVLYCCFNLIYNLKTFRYCDDLCATNAPLGVLLLLMLSLLLLCFSILFLAVAQRYHRCWLLPFSLSSLFFLFFSSFLSLLSLLFFSQFPVHQPPKNSCLLSIRVFPSLSTPQSSYC